MGSPYDSLFRDYVEELLKARDEAMRWWDTLIQAEQGPGDAYAHVRLRWPAGPASYPRIIAVYRKYYLACEELNAQLEKSRRAAPPPRAVWGKDDEEDAPGIIPPVRLLRDGLEPVNPELSKFMEALVLSPIGVDVKGNVT